MTLTESVLGVALTQVSGGVQVALTTFVIVFALIVAGAFFLILWNRPYVFYSPSEYGDTDPKQFVEAMRPTIPQRVAEQISMVEEVESRPNDAEPRHALIHSLIDEQQNQILILMHEQKLSLPYSEYGSGFEFQIEATRSWSSGSMSGYELARKLSGTGLIDLNVSGPSVTLTSAGHEFAQWLINNQKKSNYLKTPFGGWGTPNRVRKAPFFSGNAIEGEGEGEKKADVPAE